MDDQDKKFLSEFEQQKDDEYSDSLLKQHQFDQDTPSEWKNTTFEAFVPSAELICKKADDTQELLPSIMTILKLYGGHPVPKRTLLHAMGGVLSNHSHSDQTCQGTMTLLAYQNKEKISFDQLTYVLKKDANSLPSMTINDETYSGVELGKLYDQMIQPIKPENEIVNKDNLQAMIDLCAYLSLILLRFAKKEAMDVFSYILLRSPSVFNSLFGHSESVIAVPSQKVPDLLKVSLPFEDQDFKRLLGLIVNSYLTSQSVTLKGFYQATCLLTLGENGLGLISWTIKAASKLGSGSLKPYLEMLANGLTYRSLIKFVKWWKTEDKPKSWPFCRLFVPSAMSDYATRANVEMCLVGAYIAMGLTDAQKKLPLMKQFDGTANIRPICLKIAEYCIREIAGSKIATTGTARAKKMAEAINMAGINLYQIQPIDDFAEGSEDEEDDEDGSAGII